MSAKSQRILALLNNSRARAKLLQSINKENAPEGAPYNAHEMTLLKDMNAMEDEHEKHMDGLKGVE